MLPIISAQKPQTKIIKNFLNRFSFILAHNISTKNLSIKCFKVIFIYFGPSDLRKNPKILKKTFLKVIFIYFGPSAQSHGRQFNLALGSKT